MNTKNFSLNSLTEKISSFFLFLLRQSWIITIIVFLGVLAGAIWVWWECFYQPVPSNNAKMQFEQGREDFSALSQKTARVIRDLKAKEERFNNIPDYSNQREIFTKKEEPESAPENVPNLTTLNQPLQTENSPKAEVVQ